jgi:hypothetical protein
MSPNTSIPRYDLFDTQDMSRYLDAEGRPLGEHRAPESVKAGVPMELKQCPYSGSRYKHANPMNVSALRQMTRHWAQALGTIDFIRQRYEARVGRAPLGLVDVWRVSKIISFMPGYLLFRAEGALTDGQLPPPVSAAYKIIVGIAATLERLVLQGMMMEGYNDATVMTPEELFSLVEESGDLVGLEQVCAGPANLIQEALQVLMVGPKEPVEARVIQALVPDVDALFTYARHGTHAHLTAFAYSLRRQVALKELAERLGQLGTGTVASRLTEQLGTVGEGQQPLAGNLAQTSTALVEMPPEAITQLVEAFARLALDPVQPAEPEPFEAPDVDGLLKTQLTAGLATAGEELADSTEREDLAQALASCVLLENEALRHFTLLQGELDRVLGYPTSARGPLERTALTRYFGRAPRDAFQELLPALHAPEGASASRLAAGQR